MGDMGDFFIPASGFKAGDVLFKTNANNIANSQTVGFKSSHVELETAPSANFQTALNEAYSEYVKKHGLDDESDPVKPNSQESGSGVQVAGITKNFTQGTFDITNRELDFAIDGNGFFAVRLPDGQVGYTRAGNFVKDRDGNLVDQSGHYLDPPVKIPINATSVVVDQTGRILVQEPNSATQTEIGQISVATFTNPSGLVSVGQNLFVATPASGDPVVDVPGQNRAGKIKQYALESSNVNVIGELMQLIVNQRYYEIISKSVQAKESMLRSAVDIARA